MAMLTASRPLTLAPARTGRSSRLKMMRLRNLAAASEQVQRARAATQHSGPCSADAPETERAVPVPRRCAARSGSLENRRPRARFCTDRCRMRSGRDDHRRRVPCWALAVLRWDLQFPVDAVDSVGRPIRDRSEHGQ